MIHVKRLLAMVRARMMEVLRDRLVLIWNLLFAPLLMVGMALVFSGGPQAVAKAGVVGDAPLTAETHAFLGTPALQFYAETDLDAGIRKVGRQSIDLLLDLRSEPPRYWVNGDSDKGLLLQKLLVSTDGSAVAQPVSGEELRYADWLVPGLLALNITISSLFAVGHVIVRYRKTGYLKRLKGTPLRAAEFIGAQMIACLILVVTITASMFAVCTLLLDLRMEGSYLTLLLVAALGSMSMIALSLLVAARLASEELSVGLLNLIAWPMLVLSGVFFSLDGAPALVRGLADLLPLTYMLDAVRAVMLDGAGLFDVAPDLLMLCAMTAGFVAIGAAMFRWTQD